MATKRNRFMPDSSTGEPPRKKKRSTKAYYQLETFAPRATLDGLPDNIVLCIMALLSLRSLISLSRVCKRFHHLCSDASIWNNVDMSIESVGVKLDPRKLKNIIRTHLPESVSCVKLSSNVFKNKPPIVTEPVLDLLFERCPNISSITLHDCDITVFTRACKLYHTNKLTHLSVVGCSTRHEWLQEIRPSWPNITHISFEQTTMIGDGDIRYIAQSPFAKSLRYLNLGGCYRVSPECLLNMCSEEFTALRVLDVRRKYPDKASSLQELLKHDKLKHIHILV